MQETQETQVQPLGQKDLLKEGMATHSSTLAWRIPWTEEPSGLQSIGLQRGGHGWSDLAHADADARRWKVHTVLLQLSGCVVFLPSPEMWGLFNTTPWQRAGTVRTLSSVSPNKMLVCPNSQLHIFAECWDISHPDNSIEWIASRESKFWQGEQFQIM